jgi:hypothetical protein
MTKRIVLIYLVFVSMGLSQSLSYVLEKHIETIGGSVRLKAINASVTEWTDTQLQVPLKLVTYVTKGQKVRIEMASPSLLIIFAYNGTVGWKRAIVPGVENRPVMPLTDSETKTLVEEAQIGKPDLLLNYPKIASNVTLIGRKDIEGRDAYALLVVGADGKGITRYIDSSSFEEIEDEWKELATGSVFKRTSEDFRRVDGVMTPFHMKLYKDGKLIVNKLVTKVTFPPILADSLFERPAATPNQSTDPTP